MPFGMTENVQATFIGEILYVGGGESPKRGNCYVVMSYNTATFKWSRLPQYSTRLFGLVAIKDDLVLLGGRNRKGESMNLVGVYSPSMSVWEHPYEPMPRAQISPSAVAYDDDWIIVVGNAAQKLEESFFAPVQLLNCQSKIWHEILLSIPFSSVFSRITSSCIIGGNWYVMDSSSNIVRVSIASLMALHSMDKYSHRVLSSLDVSGMKIVGLNGSLLSIECSASGPSKMFCHIARTNEWNVVGELPTNILCQSAAVSSDKELWIIGGSTSSYSANNKVYIGHHLD